ncbi:MAG: hypothetical protein ACN4G0_16155, partial [Polyangiales bacterium]
MSRDVGVGQLVDELEQRGDRLPFEIGAFVALEACEGLIQEAVKLDPDDIRVTLEGRVVVSEAAERVGAAEAADSLVSLLARLLIAAGPGVPPYLLQLVEESDSGQSPRDLRHLHDAIEASLIPINRGASRRVLARLVRESDRPPAPEAVEVDPRELDTELEELLRDPEVRSLGPMQGALPLAELQPQEPITEKIRIPASLTREAELEGQPETVPVPPSRPAVARSSAPVPELRPLIAPDTAAATAAARPRPVQVAQEPITATIRKWSSEDDARSDAESAPDSAQMRASEPASVAETVSVTASGTASGIDSVTASGAEPAVDAQPALETPTESVFGAGSVTHSESVPASLPQSEPGTSVSPAYDRPSLPAAQPPTPRVGMGVFLLAAVLGLGVGLGVYALVSTGTLDKLTQQDAPAPVAAQSGDIGVSVTPSDAQIFIFVGRGPTVVPDLPVGSAHEFIVFDQGLRPVRAVTREGAAWARNDAGALYELAIQTQAVAEPAGAHDFGSPSTEPAPDTVGETGTVRIITNPPGAKVYRYVGSGPSALIPAASIHEGQEVLVYHPE